VEANWDDIKRDEKQRSSIFEGVATSQPALAYAQQLQRKAGKIGFDWDDLSGPLAKITEELDEVRGALDAGDDDTIGGELGDLLFAVVNTARHAGVDAELALRRAAAKFRRRLEAVEALARERGVELVGAGIATLDELWETVKAGE
jgi:MazG family protein